MIRKKRFGDLSATTGTSTTPQVDILGTLLNLGTGVVNTVVGTSAQDTLLRRQQELQNAQNASNERIIALQNQGLTYELALAKANAEAEQATMIKNIVSIGLVLIVLGGGGFLIYKLVKKGK